MEHSVLDSLRLKKTCTALAVLSLASAPAWAVTYYVSPSGNNANAGTSVSAPLKTIQSAMDRVVPGDVVYVRGGTYREQVEVKRGGMADNPVSLFAYPGEIPVIKGSDVVTGWVQEPGTPVWKRTGWPHNSQQVFVNFDTTFSKSLQQVGMPSRFYTSWEYPTPVGSGRANMAAGRFYYDPAAQTLYVQLADNGNPNKRVIEASTRRRLLMMHQPHIRAKGLRFRHSNLSAFAQQGAAVELSGHSVIEQCDIQHVDFAGLGMAYLQDNSRVENCNISNNGSTGINAAGSRNFTVRNVTLMNNNYRNFNAYWHAGGLKATTNAWGTIENSVMGNNKGPGIWFDYSRSGMPIVVRNNHVHDNSAGEAGIFFEVSDNGLFYNNVVSRNLVRGIYLAAGNNSKVYNNTVYGTVKRAGIEVAGMPRGTATLTNNLIYNNIVSHGTSQYDLYFAVPDGTTIAGNRSDYNLFFKSLAASIVLRQGGTYTSLASWQAATGHDTGSRSADPKFVAPGKTATGLAVAVGSQAIDAGTSLTSVPNDYRNSPRPSGIGYDIGAFEAGATAVAAATR
jgi:parallel beta-helix repeat protein